jgi:hypothetical protein
VATISSPYNPAFLGREHRYGIEVSIDRKVQLRPLAAIIAGYKALGV